MHVVFTVGDRAALCLAVVEGIEKLSLPRTDLQQTVHSSMRADFATGDDSASSTELQLMNAV